MLRVTMWDTCEAVAITAEQREVLQTWIAARNSPQKVVFRSRIVLAAARGMSNNRIAQELKTSRPTVIMWRDRFSKAGPAALIDDAAGRGRHRKIPAAKVKKIVETTLYTTPTEANTWSVDM